MTILRSADHCRTLGAAMWDLRQSGRLVDIALHCHGHSAKAHRVVLSVSSPVLRASLVPSFSNVIDHGSHHGHRVMPDAVPTCLHLDDAVERALDLEIMLEFLYRGEVSLPESDLDSLLRTAKFLQVDSLVDAILISKSTGSTDQDQNSSDYVTVKAEPSSSHDDHVAKVTKYRRTSMDPANVHQSFPSTSCATVNESTPSSLLKDVMGSNHDATSTFYAARTAAAEHVHGHHVSQMVLLDHDQTEYLSDGHADDYEAASDVDNLDDDAEFDYEDYGECDQEEMPLCDEASQQQQPTVDGIQQPSATRPTVRKRRYTCKQSCNKLFFSRRGYMAHVKSHSVRARCHKCPICGFLTGQMWSLTNHLAIIHKKSASSNKVFTVISPAVISNEKAREYLAEAETGRLDAFVNDVPATKPNGGEILLFKTSNKTDDNYLRDGYNFWQLGNRVTKELGLRRIYFKLHRGSRQFAEGFSRYVFKLMAPANEHVQYVLVHYVGDESVYEPVSHGNTKSVRTTHTIKMPQTVTTDNHQQQEAELNNGPMSSGDFNVTASRIQFTTTTMEQLHGSDVG